MNSKLRYCLITLLSISLVLPMLRGSAQAQSRVTISIGKPSIWSLAQAHYLLANMRQADRALKMKQLADLDPNSINGARFDVLRTLIGAEVQVSTPQAFQNSVAQQQFQTDAWKISLQASAVAFPREKSPTDSRDARAITRVTNPGDNFFDILVPNESSEGFWIDKINYTPVRKGDYVTALLTGRYFSPLTGVMVDGAPLARTVALAKHENDPTATASPPANSQGEFEYLNSNQIVMNFKTASTDFVGTPLITLVTPEKTAAINYFKDLLINFHYTDSLQHYSLAEPMVTIRGRNLNYVTRVSFGSAVVTGEKIKQRHPNVLLVEVPRGPEGGVQILLEGAIGTGPGGRRISNILDFTSPGKAIFKYVKPEKPPS
jgi:hypothetical protein